MKHINSQIEGHNSLDLKYIKTLLSSFSLNKNDIPWNMFSWVDQDLRLIVNNEKDVLRPLESKDKPYLQEAFRNPNKLYFGKLAYGRLSGDLIIPAGMAVANRNGKVIGGLIFGLQIKKLIHNMTNSINEGGVEFAFFDQSHQMMFGSEKFVNYENISSNLAIVGNKSNSGILTKFSFLSRSSTLNYYQKIDKNSYFVVTQYDRELFEKNLISKILPYLFELSLILITLYILVFIFKKLIINPILQLSLVSKIATIDHDDKDLILPKSIIPEINQLSNAIKSIASFIKNEKSLNKEIQLSNQKLQVLTKSVNHDLRNYISGILGLANIITDKKGLKKESYEEIIKQDQEFGKMIADQAELMLKFSESLMTDEGIAKIIESQSKINNSNTALQKDEEDLIKDFEDVDVKKLVEELIMLKKPFLLEQKISVKTDIDKTLPILRTNLIELRKILDNLITNAVKYSNEGEEVVIRVKTLRDQSHNSLYIEIIDSGIGMTSEEVAKALVGNIESIDKSGLNKEIDSYGLGLPIVKQAIENLGARMEIESQKRIGTNVKMWF
ncbi:MAG: signal transduction histidine kinase [Myxococcota bacterium]|jgi:signal transduction histidine kinase